MKILIFGTGFLGTKLINSFSKIHEVVGADITPLEENIKKVDATNEKEIRILIEIEKPDVVIDTIALTSSQSCEENPTLCRKLNYETAKNISHICKEKNIKMIFISSSYVFDGNKGNYSETDFVFPSNKYSETKIYAEKEVSKLRDYLILRVDLMYGYNGPNKKNGVFDKILSREEIKINNPNQLRQPVFVDDLSEVILILLDKKEKGIFHVAGPDKIFLFDFLRELEKIVCTDSKIKIVVGKLDLNRPRVSTLNTYKITSLGIKTTSLNNAIKKISKQFTDS
jgi:dTDP-4-dehydrorhamnose reductase